MNEILDVLKTENNITIIIIGETKSGKTKLSKLLNSKQINSVIYEAGAWARKEFIDKYGSFDSLSISDRKLMNEFVLDKLNSNANTSINYYYDWFSSNINKKHILCGFRNPYDVENIIKNYSKIMTINIIDDDSNYDELFINGVNKINELLVKKSKYYFNINKSNII